MFITSIIQLPLILQYTVIYLWLFRHGLAMWIIPVDVGSQKVANASGYRALLWVPMKAHSCRWFDDTVDGWNVHQLRLVVYPIIYRVLYIPGGADFVPSTVSITACVFFVTVCCELMKFMELMTCLWCFVCFYCPKLPQKQINNQ